eukprot:CAMPEP_0172825018 /NCGR_PEP_ID=MMETSP1075-20121228/18378_1 /TAXON_ID=2916 /ORGANISM="Ceratium fusus, Strain PA161109" /LENGTH=68 /DNA_ID=CAMNT_0013666383 /DNA_START=582 /DNA_END=785 /DNA_ORIENTATION=+
MPQMANIEVAAGLRHVCGESEFWSTCLFKNNVSSSEISPASKPCTSRGIAACMSNWRAKSDCIKGRSL